MTPPSRRFGRTYLTVTDLNLKNKVSYARGEYALTETGRDLVRVLAALTEWYAPKATPPAKKRREAS
jgi:DNA-binding HxlR family transcriptional regulator